VADGFRRQMQFTPNKPRSGGLVSSVIWLWTAGMNKMIRNVRRARETGRFESTCELYSDVIHKWLNITWTPANIFSRSLFTSDITFMMYPSFHLPSRRKNKHSKRKMERRECTSVQEINGKNFTTQIKHVNKFIY
jgi:hypothetical protein